jgi:hypothetical protein
MKSQLSENPTKRWLLPIWINLVELNTERGGMVRWGSTVPPNPTVLQQPGK